MRKPHLECEAGKLAFRRLSAVAREHGINVHSVALRYALERLLFRVFDAPVGDGPMPFLDPESKIRLDRSTITVKGGLVITFLEDMPPLMGRTTGDADLHLTAFGGSMEAYAGALRSGLAGPPATGPDDGVRFDVEGIRVATDRDEHTGGTLVVPVQVGGLYLQVKTDVTFDPRPMHEDAEVVPYPSVLPDAGLPPAMVRKVPYEFMLADKFGAAVEYGILNKRLRDYPDMLLVLRRGRVDGAKLAGALAAQARFKGWILPATMADASAFSDAFAERQSNRWENEKKTRNYAIKDSLHSMVAELRAELGPVLEAAHGIGEVPAWASGPR